MEAVRFTFSIKCIPLMVALIVLFYVSSVWNMMKLPKLSTVILSIISAIILLVIKQTSATLSKSDKKGNGKHMSNKNVNFKTLKEKWEGPIDQTIYERGKFEQGIHIMAVSPPPIARFSHFAAILSLI